MQTVEYDDYLCSPSGNVCPYCFRVNGETEGSSEMLENGTIIFSCGYCNKDYKMIFSD